MMNFMVMLSRVCQKNFMNYKLAEKLANLLNYSLNIFVSPLGLQLKVSYYITCHVFYRLIIWMSTASIQTLYLKV